MATTQVGLETQATSEPVVLCPQCRTTIRRPVAPGRSLCQQHLERKRESQQTRRQRARARCDDEAALNRETNRANQSSQALLGSHQPMQAAPRAQLANQALNPHPGSHSHALSPVFGDQQFQWYMSQQIYSSPIAPIQNPQASQGSSTWVPQLNPGTLPQSATHPPFWQGSVSARFPSPPPPEPALVGYDSGYYTAPFVPNGPLDPTRPSFSGDILPLDAPEADLPQTYLKPGEGEGLMNWLDFAYVR